MRAIEVATTGAFLMEGLTDFMHAAKETDPLGLNAPDLGELLGCGVLELAYEVCEYAEVLTYSFLAPAPDHPGVFHYEVCNAFGWWFAMFIDTNRRLPTRFEGASHVQELVAEFHQHWKGY